MSMIAWTESTGAVRIATSHLAARALEQRLRAKGVIPAGAAVLHDSILPPTRAARHQWVVQAGRIVEDPTRPAPVHPRQAQLEALGRALTLEEVKAAVRELVTR